MSDRSAVQVHVWRGSGYITINGYGILWGWGRPYYSERNGYQRRLRIGNFSVSAIRPRRAR